MIGPFAATGQSAEPITGAAGACLTASDDHGYVTSTLREWKRRDWGPGGTEFHWWCTETDEAFVGAVPAYVYLRDEIVEIGETRGWGARGCFIPLAQHIQHRTQLTQCFLARLSDHGERNSRLFWLLVHQVEGDASLHTDQRDVVA